MRAFKIHEKGESKINELKTSEIKSSPIASAMSSTIDTLTLDRKIKELTIERMEKEPKDKWKYFKWASVITILSTLLGITPTIIQSVQKQPQEKYIVLPKVQIIHEPVYLKSTDSLGVKVK
jgi:hypothetical protein